MAQGKMDAMIEAKTNLYDIAAMAVIVEEAGGKVTDIEGNPVGIHTESIIASNSVLHQTILNYFKKGGEPAIDERAAESNQLAV